jgi:two-component system, NtrC family, sensor kinase
VFVLFAVAAGTYAGPRIGMPLAVLSGGLVVSGFMVFRRNEAKAFSRMLEARLLQTQKMAAIGELSAGIAHEINNPLAIIAQESELLRHYLKALGQDASGTMRNEIEDSVAQVEAQVSRCREITHRLLTLARKMDPILQEVDLNNLVEDMAVLVEREARDRGVVIVREFADSLDPAWTDPPLIRQVVLNLLNNGLQAIEGSGQVTVRTRDTGRGFEVVVEDNGSGIAQEHLSRIFNPFFTTKSPGQGTGLGLSISQAIMDKLGGEITVESEPGQGSRFTVHLPKHGPSVSRS